MTTRRTVLASLALMFAVLAFAPAVEAQTEMRYYFVPKADAGILGTVPKYTTLDALRPGWAPSYAAMDYGAEDVYLIALDLTAEDHTLLTAQTDVLAVPTITNQVSALALPTVKAKLEAVYIPAHYVTTDWTYRQVLSRVMRLVQLVQRARTQGDRLFTGVTLDSRINQLTPAQRAALQSAAASFGVSYAAVTGPTTLRHALVIVADQLFPAGLPFAGDTF